MIMACFLYFHNGAYIEPLNFCNIIMLHNVRLFKHKLKTNIMRKAVRILIWIFLLIGIAACSNNTNHSKNSEQTVAATILGNKVEHSLSLEENIDLIGKRIQNTLD